MPNYCDNIVIISHEDKDILRRAAEAYNQERLLDFFYPVENKDDITKEWLHENWGTRSDIEHLGDVIDIDEAVENGILELRFNTAWTPPLGVFEKAVESGFKIKAFYYEDGNRFAGIWYNKDHEHFDLSESTADEAEEMLPEELNERFSISFHIRSDDEYETEGN